MNRAEAIRLLEREMASFRQESYADLARRTQAGALAYERSGAGGATYQLEIEFLWDDRPGGNVRVIGSIDDGGWRAFFPLSRSFIKLADSSFVGE